MKPEDGLFMAIAGIVAFFGGLIVAATIRGGTGVVLKGTIKYTVINGDSFRRHSATLSIVDANTKKEIFSKAISVDKNAQITADITGVPYGTYDATCTDDTGGKSVARIYHYASVTNVSFGIGV